MIPLSFPTILIILAIGAVIIFIRHLTVQINALKKEKDDLYAAQTEIAEIMRQHDLAMEIREKCLELAIAEKEQSCPSVAAIIANAVRTSDAIREDILRTKKHPAPKASEELSKIADEKKELMRQLKECRHQLIYYENLYPLLKDLKHLGADEINALIYNLKQRTSSEYNKDFDFE